MLDNALVKTVEISQAWKSWKIHCLRVSFQDKVGIKMAVGALCSTILPTRLGTLPFYHRAKRSSDGVSILEYYTWVSWGELGLEVTVQAESVWILGQS